MTKKGQKPATIRDSNIKLVMQLLYAKSRSRSDLAKSTKLSNPALTKIIDQLLKLGFVKEGAEIITNTRGRKKVDLVVNRNFATVLGIDFSSNNIQIILADFSKRAIVHREIPDSEIITREVLAKVVINLKELLERTECGVKCICVGVPGKINAKTHEVQKTFYKYRDCRDVDFGAFFEKEVGIKTILANDASLQMLAEQRRQEGRTDCALIYNDFGMGGALWLKGEAYESESGFAAELGAIPIQYNGETLIFEDLCSINAMLRACGYALNNPDSFEKFLAAYRQGSKAEQIAVDRSAHGISLLVRNIMGVTGCRDFIINGKVSDFGDAYLARIQDYLSEEKIFDVSELQVHYGHFSKNGTVQGTIEKAIDFIIDSEVKNRKQ